MFDLSKVSKSENPNNRLIFKINPLFARFFMIYNQQKEGVHWPYYCSCFFNVSSKLTVNIKETITIKETKIIKVIRRGATFFGILSLTWLFFPFPELYRKSRGTHSLWKQSKTCGVFWQKQTEVIYQLHFNIFHFPHIF